MTFTCLSFGTNQGNHEKALKNSKSSRTVDQDTQRSREEFLEDDRKTSIWNGLGILKHELVQDVGMDGLQRPSNFLLLYISALG